jgi:hypothetical protein
MNLAQVDALYPAWAQRTLKVLSKEGGFVPFALNKMQRRSWARRLESTRPRLIRLKARQMGSTTLEFGSHIQRCQFLDAYRVAVVALKGEEGAVPLGQKLREMVAMQPDAWKAEAPRLVTETDTLLRWANGSAIHLFTQGGRDPGVSYTFHRLHFTEYGKYTDPAATRAAMLPALATTGEEIIESTAQGYNHFEELCREARENPQESLYDFEFFPWWDAPEYVAPVPATWVSTSEEEALIQQHHLSQEQIAFRRIKQKELGPLFAQEYAENPDDCFLATGDSWFAYDLIDLARQGVMPPIAIEEDGLLHIFEEPQPGIAYVIGADAAEGVPKGDHSAATVRRAATGTLAATLTDCPPSPSSRQGRMTTTTFPALLNKLGRRYNDAGVMVERNHPGPAVIDALAHVHAYPQLLRFDGDIGIRTNVATKPVLQQQYRDALQTRDLATRDERIVKQMSNFIVLNPERQGSSGRKLAEVCGARPGTHDDLLMADMICAFARSRALAMALQGPSVIRWR